MAMSSEKNIKKDDQEKQKSYKKKKNEKKNDEAWRHTKRCDRPWMRARWRNECSSSSSGGESTQWNRTTNSIITEAPQAAVVTRMVGNRHLVTRFLPLRRSPISHLSLSTPREAKELIPLEEMKEDEPRRNRDQV